jgi:hypothetical protein
MLILAYSDKYSGVLVIKVISTFKFRSLGAGRLPVQ